MLADPQTSYSPSYPVLHKAQLLISSSLPAHNRSILFLMGCTTEVWQIDPRRTACPAIGGNTRRSRSGCVSASEAGYFRNFSPPPVLSCAADRFYQPPYIKGAISRRTGRHPRNGHRHHLLTKCQARKQGENK